MPLQRFLSCEVEHIVFIGIAIVAFEEPQLSIIFIDTVPVHPVSTIPKQHTPYVARESLNVGEIAGDRPVIPLPGTISPRDVGTAIGARHGFDTLDT